jgi:hypothetical protein
MPTVRRHLALAALVVCSLSSQSAFGQDPVWLSDSAPPALAAGDAPEFWGPGVWGRVNPNFWGYPSISVASDLVVLSRPAPVHQPILFDGSFNPILDASQLGSTAAAGGRFNVTFFNPNGWDFLIDGLFMGEFDTQRHVDRSGGVNLIFYQGIALAQVNTISYRSNLNTGEFNVRRRLSPQFALLGGIRVLQLSEDFDFTDGASGGGYFSQAGNRLFGGQLGAEVVLPARGYGRFFASGKYGIYNDRFQINAQALNPGGAPINVRVHDNMASGVGDFTAGFEVTTVPRMTIRFGYQCLVLNDVALSVDQLNQFDIFSNAGTVHKGNPVFHGGFVGLVFTF